jgi:cold shock CspA family protein
MDELKDFVVKTWNPYKGYGFACEPNHQDKFYLHASSIVSLAIVRPGSRIRARVVSPCGPGQCPELADVEVVDAEVAEPVVDENGFEDFVVVYWNSDKGIGSARTPAGPRGVCLFFGTRDILTVGEETLRPGSRIRGHRVPDPKYPEKDALVDVEIYAVEPEPEPDKDFVETMSHAQGLKRYL